MAVYDFKCPECEHIQDGTCAISERDEFRPPCEECGTPTERTFIPENFRGEMVLKGYGWARKDMKENVYRKRRSQQMKKRQKDNHPVPKLAPNVDGERVANWSDAKKLAKDKGHDTRNYDVKVRNLSKGNA